MIDKIRPLNDRILIKRKKVEEKTAGGIIIPDTAQEKSQWGTVIAVSKGRPNKDGVMIPLSVKEGDEVLFGKYAGTEVDSDRLILREEEILGVSER